MLGSVLQRIVMFDATGVAFFCRAHSTHNRVSYRKLVNSMLSTILYGTLPQLCPLSHRTTTCSTNFITPFSILHRLPTSCVVLARVQRSHQIIVQLFEYKILQS